MAAIHYHGYWGAHKPWRRLLLHRDTGLEIILVTKGEFTWEVEGRAEPIVPGTAFFTLPHQRHGAGDRPHPGVELYYVICDPARLGLPAADLRWLNQTLHRTNRHAFPAPALLRSLIPAIIRELSGQAQGREAAATGMLRAAVVELARLVTANPPRRPAQADRTDAMRRLLAELEARSAECWTLDQMAAASGLKRSQFAKRFSEITGDTPITYLNRIRVRRAQQLLRAGQQTVTEIGLACGFQSSQYFATVYRQFTGVSPSASTSAK